MTDQIVKKKINYNMFLWLTTLVIGCLVPICNVVPSIIFSRFSHKAKEQQASLVAHIKVVLNFAITMLMLYSICILGSYVTLKFFPQEIQVEFFSVAPIFFGGVTVFSAINYGIGALYAYRGKLFNPPITLKLIK